MLLNKDSVFPYGKYKGLPLIVLLDTYKTLDYFKWWDKTILEYPFNNEIKSILSNKIKELKELQDAYEIEEVIRD